MHDQSSLYFPVLPFWDDASFSAFSGGVFVVFLLARFPVIVNVLVKLRFCRALTIDLVPLQTLIKEPCLNLCPLKVSR